MKILESIKNELEEYNLVSELVGNWENVEEIEIFPEEEELILWTKEGEEKIIDIS